jgi:hypothetical protein
MVCRRLLGVIALVTAVVGSANATQTRTSFGVSATVAYNCAMDMSKLTAAQRKVVDDYCRQKRAAEQRAKTAALQSGK